MYSALPLDLPSFADVIYTQYISPNSTLVFTAMLLG